MSDKVTLIYTLTGNEVEVDADRVDEYLASSYYTKVTKHQQVHKRRTTKRKAVKKPVVTEPDDALDDEGESDDSE